MKKILFGLALLLFAAFAKSQSFTLKGALVDTSQQEPAALKNSVISLLRSSDSILQKFTRTDANGKFEIKQVPAGKYILLATHPDYADYVDIMDIKADVNLGDLQVFSKAVVLQNVIVRGSPIRMRGDTLAYIADSFKVREGATVEDLLKKLPGIQVNAKGEITAQGERVEKVLVDGEEFFGDDPTLATQNMIAKAVKEVQVFDKKSEQSDFTGVDDGQKQKTINLKLKDEYKKGYFGKVNLAGGLPDRWENSAMINAFKDKRKFSVYGKMVNTNETGLGWGEENQYGGGMGSNMEVNDDGGVSVYSSNDEFGGAGGFSGEGLPRSWMAGSSYSNKWYEDKVSLNGAYRFQNLITEGTTTTSTQTILPDTQFFNNQNNKFKSSRWRHRANMRTDIKIDSLQSLTILADGNYGESETITSLFSEALTSDSLPVNRNEKNTANKAYASNFNMSVLYKKKFEKKGRTLSVNFSERYGSNQGEGLLRNYLSIYSKGIYDRSDTTDQKKESDNMNNTIDTRATYTEPIGKSGIVEVNAGFNYRHSEQELLSYDKVNGKYESLNELFSNDFTFKTKTTRGGLAYRYNYKKLTFGLGADVSHSNWEQEDHFRDTTRSYSFNNIFPRANFTYKLGQYSRVAFNYNGNTQAPSIDQLQPVANNNDPLNIAVGNPNLKQAFRQTIRVNYNFYQVLKEQGFWSNIWLNFTDNDFSSRDAIDTAGRKIYQTVNVDGNYNTGGWMGYNFRWKKPDLRMNFFFNPSISKRTNFVNGIKNRTSNQAYRFGFDVSKSKDKKYELNLGADIGYNYGESSIRPEVKTKYWTATPRFNGSYQFPWDIEFLTNFDYNWRQATDVFANNNNTFIWNASLEKKILKSKELKLGFTVRDILNQNIGFRRDINANYITERTYDVIRRYWLVTLKYSFNKGPKKETEW
jgi:hypothetical protein